MLFIEFDAYSYNKLFYVWWNKFLKRKSIKMNFVRLVRYKMIHFSSVLKINLNNLGQLVEKYRWVCMEKYRNIMLFLPDTIFSLIYKINGQKYANQN